ncbi:MAG: RHS repeat-associated core domain-containing protein [Steroidobacteraceae bacterium]
MQRQRRKSAYDGNGNATARQGNSIVWSSYNYPTTVNAGSGSTAETVAFAYGPDRKRWQQMYTGNGTSETTNYVGGLLEVVSSGSTTTYRHYIYAGNEPVVVYARSSAGTTFRYTLSDHQGSVSDFTYSSGSSVVNESFTPFGLRRNPTTWSGAASNSDLTTAAGITRQGYTFQTQLGLWMGMNHMNGRVEDAVTGRMLSADPHVPDRTNPQSYNRYTYVNNNPLTATDPSGFCTPAWACKQDAGSGLGKCRVCGGSDPGDAGFNNLAMQQFAATSADPDQDFLAGLDDIASSLANPIDQSRGCLIGCSATQEATLTVDLTPPTMSEPDGQGGSVDTVPVCASCKVTISIPPPDLSPPQGDPNTGSYWSNVWQNIVQTNGATPGAMAPTGTGLFTAGALSQAMWGTNTVTAGRWIFSGFQGVTVGAANFSTLETGVLVGYTAAANFGATGTAYEVGIAMGSMLSAIPTGGGNTVRDSLANALYNAYGPSSPYNASSTCGSGNTCGP